VFTRTPVSSATSRSAVASPESPGAIRPFGSAQTPFGLPAGRIAAKGYDMADADVVVAADDLVDFRVKKLFRSRCAFGDRCWFDRRQHVFRFIYRLAFADRVFPRKRSIMRFRATRNSHAVACSTGLSMRKAATNS